MYINTIIIILPNYNIVNKHVVMEFIGRLNRMDMYKDDRFRAILRKPLCLYGDGIFAIGVQHLFQNYQTGMFSKSAPVYGNERT